MAPNGEAARRRGDCEDGQSPAPSCERRAVPRLYGVGRHRRDCRTIFDVKPRLHNARCTHLRPDAIGVSIRKIPRSGCARMRRAAVAAFQPTRRSGPLQLTLRWNPQSSTQIDHQSSGLGLAGGRHLWRPPYPMSTAASHHCGLYRSVCRPAAACNHHTYMCIPDRHTKRGHHCGLARIRDESLRSS